MFFSETQSDVSESFVRVVARYGSTEGTKQPKEQRTFHRQLLSLPMLGHGCFSYDSSLCSFRFELNEKAHDSKCLLSSRWLKGELVFENNSTEFCVSTVERPKFSRLFNMFVVQRLLTKKPQSRLQRAGSDCLFVAVCDWSAIVDDLLFME